VFIADVIGFFPLQTVRCLRTGHFEQTLGVKDALKLVDIFFTLIGAVP
jgi:hypothetical protein